MSSARAAVARWLTESLVLAAAALCFPGMALGQDVEDGKEPVLVIAEGEAEAALDALFADPRLEGYAPIRLDAASSDVRDDASIGVGAARALLAARGVARAHVVAAAGDAAIALQLALDAPEDVGSLTLVAPSFALSPLTADAARIATPTLVVIEPGTANGEHARWRRLRIANPLTDKVDVMDPFARVGADRQTVAAAFAQFLGNHPL